MTLLSRLTEFARDMHMTESVVTNGQKQKMEKGKLKSRIHILNLTPTWIKLGPTR